MKQLLNTLYVMTQGAYLTLDHETVKVEMPKDVETHSNASMQVPLHHLGAIYTFGNVMISPFLMHKCMEDGRAIVLFNMNGRFMARVTGKTHGNVLLRQAQYEVVRDTAKTAKIAKNIVAGKLQNSRHVLLRGARETENKDIEGRLRHAAQVHADALFHLEKTDDIEEIRGFEGETANAYFDVLDSMVKENLADFKMNGRHRRPPLDPMNAILSFLYTLLLNDCISAAEGVGLDSQMGFLHVLRPGRPSLGLDLMEELRSVLADKLALTLINLRQITKDDFEERPGGAVYLSEKGRKTVVVAYQKRKQDEIHHPLLEEKLPFGLVPHVQARLLARHLRGDMEEYMPMLYL